MEIIILLLMPLVVILLLYRYSTISELKNLEAEMEPKRLLQEVAMKKAQEDGKTERLKMVLDARNKKESK